MYELFARQVMPSFTRATDSLMAAYLRTKERKEGLTQRFAAGIAKAKDDYVAERARKRL
jgi:hypothetical protein